jgi:hypothetical protein
MMVYLVLKLELGNSSRPYTGNQQVGAEYISFVLHCRDATPLF